MEPRVFDSVKFEKEKAIARFNLFCRISELRQILEILVVIGVISWSSLRIPAILKITVGGFVELSTYIFNHHVVFLIGNFIIVLLVVLCRRQINDGSNICDDREEAAPTVIPPLSSSLMLYNADGDGDGYSIGDCGSNEKRIVICTEMEKAVKPYDDVSVAIEKAAKQIRKFQRTQSEKLKREIAVRPAAKLRRSETQKHSDAWEIERLSNEEFQRTVDDFIDKHWSKKKTNE